jgi:phosphoribosylanthranilate isomerase
MAVEIKICGMTNKEDVSVALDCGADYIGFVLYDKSPRGITAQLLRKIMDSFGSELKAVAIFVNETRDFVEKIVDDCGLYAAQLHGCENPADYIGFESRMWRAVSVGRYDSCKIEFDKWSAERFVIDAAVPGQYGGTGSLADWDKAAVIAENYPAMLAGGLTPLNVAEAIARVKPLGIDVSSGLEIEPGRKDYEKIKLFMENAKR